MGQLPLELTNLVLEELMRCQDRPVHQLHDLRLVNKTFASIVTPRLFHTIDVWIGVISLEHVINISEHPQISQYVQKIIFSPLSILENPSRKNLFKGQSILAQDDLDVNLLKRAFRGMPNFHTLEIYQFPTEIVYDEITHWQCELDLRGHHTLPVLFSALEATCVKLSAFCIGVREDPTESDILPPSRRQSETTCTFAFTNLDLSVLANKFPHCAEVFCDLRDLDISGIEDWEADTNTCVDFFDNVINASDNLEVLKANNPDPDAILGLRKLSSLGPSERLRSLHIIAVQGTETAIVAGLCKHSETLENVIFENTAVMGPGEMGPEELGLGDWSTVMSELRSKTSFPVLKYFRLFFPREFWNDREEREEIQYRDEEEYENAQYWMKRRDDEMTVWAHNYLRHETDDEPVAKAKRAVGIRIDGEI